MNIFVDGLLVGSDNLDIKFKDSLIKGDILGSEMIKLDGVELDKISGSDG